jgi:hypothetical protein
VRTTNPRTRHRIVFLLIAAALLVGFAAYVGTKNGPTFAGKIGTSEQAVRATEPFLPQQAEDWRVWRVTLVREASGLRSVAPQFPASGLTPAGFPGPVWVVVILAQERCEAGAPPESATLRYIFNASSGKPIIVSGGRCFHSLMKPLGS